MNESLRILVDWGTSNFRAYLVNDRGTVIDKVVAAKGILAVPPGEFPAALERHVGAWRRRGRDGPVPVLMSGMVGSRQGWVEAPYIDCPASLDALAHGLMAVPGAPGVFVVPGVAYHDGNGHHDVMRGEEVQVFGAAADGIPAEGLYCLPGTHSKWAVADGGCLRSFTTCMTGEVFSALSEHTILGRLMVPAAAMEMPAFDRGLRRARDDGGLLAHLFGVRADALLGEIDGGGVQAYLSGILIGHEIREQSRRATPGSRVTLVGTAALLELYGRGCLEFGLVPRAVDGEDATVRGLLLVGRAREELAGNGRGPDP